MKHLCVVHGEIDRREVEFYDNSFNCLRHKGCGENVTLEYVEMTREERLFDALDMLLVSVEASMEEGQDTIRCEYVKKICESGMKNG